jgi:hypothetical protein
LPQLDINNNIAIISQVAVFFFYFYIFIDLNLFYNFFVFEHVQKVYHFLFGNYADELTIELDNALEAKISLIELCFDNIVEK